ncbi:MAG: ankyrin repeat domain-containing protein [Planctomycetota bacterium]
MIPNEQLVVMLIRVGDEAELTRMLGELPVVSATLRERISLPDPSKHSIGHGMTLLQFASIRARGEGDAARVLLHHGAELDLHSASGLGYLEKISELVEADPNLLESEIDSYLPLQFAITANQPGVIRHLCSLGADANRSITKVAYFSWEDAISRRGTTSWRLIHMAALWCFSEARVPVMNALLEAGADANCVSPLDGFRPLHLLAMGNRVEGMRFLVRRGVSVDSRSEKTAAIETGDRCPISSFGCTPLMVAAAEGFLEATTCLLDLGADPSLACDAGRTALDYAKRAFWEDRPYEAIVELLEHTA